MVLAAVNLPENPPAEKLRHESYLAEIELKNGQAIGMRDGQAIVKQSSNNRQTIVKTKAYPSSSSRYGPEPGSRSVIFT